MSFVAVVGSANVDLVVRTPRFPVAGETLLGGPFATHPGGKGANGAVAAARMQVPTQFVGALGRDAFGDQLQASLQSAGVLLDEVRRVEEATGIAQITVADDGQNTIAVAPGANGTLSESFVKAALDRIKPRVVLASLEIPMEAVSAAAGHGLLIVDPAPASELPDSLWPQIEVFKPNETETEYYTGIRPLDEASCRKAAQRLLDRGVKAVLITLGARGGYLSTHEESQLIPAPTVNVVDTTGAGDACSGALAAFLAEGHSLATSARAALAVGALTCEQAGAQEAVPTRKVLLERFPHLL